MKILIDKPLNHLAGKSHYNHNYFSYGNNGAEILEICHEDENYYDYFLIHGYEKIHLGSSEDGETIDFLTQYT
jgi:hypothetical protein